jgi:hypothetical protein
MNGRDPAIYFSGFASQGDGACYTGWYRCKPDAVKLIKAECNDNELLAIAEGLIAAQVHSKFIYGGSAMEVKITQSGNYSHSYTMQFDINWTDPEGKFQEDCIDHFGFEPLLRRFADWIYTRLEAEHDYLTSDEYLNDQLADMTFDGDGVMI